MATAWRAGFFQELHTRYEAGCPVEDIDTTHRRVLDGLLEGYGIDLDTWGDDIRNNLVHAWHQQQGTTVCQASSGRISR